MMKFNCYLNELEMPCDTIIKTLEMKYQESVLYVAITSGNV